MLRSLFSGISGLRAHQTMLDVTGNNIANVNTTGFKASQTQFQDTLSQALSSGGAAQAGLGGTNPAQVGLGVRVAGITTNFQQGAAQLTNRSTDMMINGDGFFTVRNGAQQYYTRAGSFNFDSIGQLVTSDGSLVQGWAAVGGVINANGPLSDIKLPISTLMSAQATANATFGGNIPSDAPDPTVLNRTMDVYDAVGNKRSLALTFGFSAGAWTVGATDGASTVAPTAMTFSGGGALTSPSTLTVGAVTVDLSTITGFAGLTSVEGLVQDGQQAGTLESFGLNQDGTIVGQFSNGLKQAIGQIALATFTNPTGLEKAGSSLYRTSANSGDPRIGTAGTGSRGKLAGGALEMSNVDLSAEFTNLIIAQRGFQANSRVITTSDEVLQELVNLKR
ncbi:flagellar hook protein FlgE [Pengzhenrongella sp.]|jgi:flagellar hook protein FlgE|uniref:flagellar hook protein FlgE n=1 Tax=Pengzhenrongella sp. TaxID=2888820 RepID=UPI002F951693